MRNAFIVVLVASVLAERVIQKHVHFELERVFAGYAIYGFAACAALILLAKAIGLALKRPDTYYDDDD